MGLYGSFVLVYTTAIFSFKYLVGSSDDDISLSQFGGYLNNTIASSTDISPTPAAFAVGWALQIAVLIGLVIFGVIEVLQFRATETENRKLFDDTYHHFKILNESTAIDSKGVKGEGTTYDSNQHNDKSASKEMRYKGNSIFRHFFTDFWNTVDLICFTLTLTGASDFRHIYFHIDSFKVLEEQHFNDTSIATLRLSP